MDPISGLLYPYACSGTLTLFKLIHKDQCRSRLFVFRSSKDQSLVNECIDYMLKNLDEKGRIYVHLEDNSLMYREPGDQPGVYSHCFLVENEDDGVAIYDSYFKIHAPRKRLFHKMFFDLLAKFLHGREERIELWKDMFDVIVPKDNPFRTFVVIVEIPAPSC